jgi:hypothetical protein
MQFFRVFKALKHLSQENGKNLDSARDATPPRIKIKSTFFCSGHAQYVYVTFSLYKSGIFLVDQDTTPHRRRNFDNF